MKNNYKYSKDYNEILYINFIQTMLKEYPTYESKIENRVNEILEDLKLNSKDYLKNQEKYNEYIDKDNKLKVFKARKSLFDDILPKLEKNNQKACLFVKMRYFERRNLKDIMEALKLLNSTELFNLDLYAMRYIGNKIRNSKDFLKKV